MLKVLTSALCKTAWIFSLKKIFIMILHTVIFTYVAITRSSACYLMVSYVVKLTRYFKLMYFDWRWKLILNVICRGVCRLSLLILNFVNKERWSLWQIETHILFWASSFIKCTLGNWPSQQISSLSLRYFELEAGMSLTPWANLRLCTVFNRVSMPAHHFFGLLCVT